MEQLGAAVPELRLVRPNEVVGWMAELAEDLKGRAMEGAALGVPTFVFIHGLHRFKKLRQEDEFSFSSEGDGAASAGAQFMELITEGSSHGMHLLVSLDTFNNVNRSFNRKALTEFEMRVVFQMSANDSASLIDTPAAAALSQGRAILYRDQTGNADRFRPFNWPENQWLKSVSSVNSVHKDLPEFDIAE